MNASSLDEPRKILTRLAGALTEQGIAVWEHTAEPPQSWATDNFESVVGFSLDDLRRFPDIDRLHPDDIDVLGHYLDRQQAMLAGREPGGPSEIDHRYRTDGGTFRTVQSTVQVLERNGRPVIRGLSMDVTDERERRARLEEANTNLARLNQGLTDFAQIASHDLRAPLRHLLGQVDLLRMDLERDAGEGVSPPMAKKIDERLSVIEERVATMGELIQDLLEYARSGALVTTPETVDLQALVTGTVELIAGQEHAAGGGAGAGGGIQIEVACDIGPIEINPVPLSTCVRNLVDNAVKYHPGPEGTVTVRATDRDDDLVVTVSDDGAGIDHRYHQRIFEPFQSLDSGGSGLGLATVKKVVDEQGGSIDLDSELGRGSTFTITWPIGRRPTAGQDQAPAIDMTTEGSVTVTVVDRTAPIEGRPLSSRG